LSVSTLVAMNIRLTPLIGFIFASALAAQTPAPPAITLRTPQELEQLFAPIALYPDALVALILPAATMPTDVVLAARFVNANGNPADLDRQGWDESVRALAHYPAIIRWMDENLEWTREAGEAFAGQPADVMNAIQRLRQRARASGALGSTPQQEVVMDGDNICIVPAQPEVIYVPRYDPDVVFFNSRPWFGEPLLFFGSGFIVGTWLDFDCDWHRRSVWVGRGFRGGNRRPGDRFVVPIGRPGPEGHAWRPGPVRSYTVTRPNGDHLRPPIPRPHPIMDVPPPRPGGGRDPDFRRGGTGDSPRGTVSPLSPAANRPWEQAPDRGRLPPSSATVTIPSDDRSRSDHPGRGPDTRLQRGPEPANQPTANRPASVPTPQSRTPPPAAIQPAGNHPRRPERNDADRPRTDPAPTARPASQPAPAAVQAPMPPPNPRFFVPVAPAAVSPPPPRPPSPPPAPPSNSRGGGSGSDSSGNPENRNTP
jgi:hypothetical protein